MAVGLICGADSTNGERGAREELDPDQRQRLRGTLRTEGEIAARQQNGPMYDLTIQISRFFCNPGVAAALVGLTSHALHARTTGPSSS